jgi:hypothetical protein
MLTQRQIILYIQQIITFSHLPAKQALKGMVPDIFLKGQGISVKDHYISDKR